MPWRFDFSANQAYTMDVLLQYNKKHLAVLPARGNDQDRRYLQLTHPEPTDHIIDQDRAFFRAIEALAIVEPSSPFLR